MAARIFFDTNVLVYAYDKCDLAKQRIARVPDAEFYKRAVMLQERHGLASYDTLIVQAAIDLECTTLYSEDLQDGQKFGGLTIRNPFQ